MRVRKCVLSLERSVWLGAWVAVGVCLCVFVMGTDEW